MSDQLERLIRAVYKNWKCGQLKTYTVHPDEEAWACFLEGRLSQKESDEIKAHLLSCNACAEVLAAQLTLNPVSPKEVPKELLEWMKRSVGRDHRPPVLEIFLVLKEKALEILSTTGDVLVGQEFVPAPVLRSRQIKDFKDEVTVLKDFQDIRVEVKIENRPGGTFDLVVFVKDKQTHRIIKDLRVTLLRDALELESYMTTSDRVTFEHILVGKYTVEISNIESKIASVLLDIKK